MSQRDGPQLIKNPSLRKHAQRLPAGLYFDEESGHIRSQKLGIFLMVFVPTLMKSIVLTPFERVSIILQTQQTVFYARDNYLGKPGVYTSGKIPEKIYRYKGVFNVFKNLREVDRSNMKTFYRGNVPLIFYNLLNSTYMQLLFVDRVLPFLPMEGTLAVMAGVTILQTISYPLRVASVRMMSPIVPETKLSMIKELKSIYNSHNDRAAMTRAFYKGYVSYSLHNLIFSYLFHKTSRENKIPLGAVLSYIACFPFLSISNNQIVSSLFPLVIDKNSTKIESKDPAVLAHQEKYLRNQNTQYVYNGFLDCAKKIYKTSGIRGFYYGFGPHIFTLPLFYLLQYF